MNSHISMIYGSADSGGEVAPSTTYQLGSEHIRAPLTTGGPCGRRIIKFHIPVDAHSADLVPSMNDWKELQRSISLDWKVDQLTCRDSAKSRAYCRLCDDRDGP